MADATGATVWRWDQVEPFGNNPANDDPDGNAVAFDLPLRLPGQQYDKETGLHYNYFRDFNPSIGRYGESDPIGLRGGLNTYAYVDGRPIYQHDPRGLATYTDRCKGRYSRCRATQREDSWTVVNWARWYICKSGIDEACKKAPSICCEADRTDCLDGLAPDGSDTMTPEQAAKVAKCTADYARCMREGAK